VTTTIRPATCDDLPRLGALRATAGRPLPDLESAVAAGDVLLSVAADGRTLGAVARSVDALWLWVAPGPATRRQAVAAALVTNVLAMGAADAADAHEGMAAGDAGAARRSFASIHVQTADTAFVERTARQFVPRLGRSGGTVILPPRDGWTAVYDALCDRDRKGQRRFAEELSVRLGIVVVALAVEEGAVVRMLLFERGRLVDEYLSVPDFHGPRPPGEALALAVNPTLVARLTGADPGAVRTIARTAASTAELPPAVELIAELGALLGLHGAGHGYDSAAAAAGATLIGYGAGTSPG
jgi:hypothetical protein